MNVVITYNVRPYSLEAVMNRTAATLHPPPGLPTLVFSTHRTFPNLARTPPAPPAQAVFVGKGLHSSTFQLSRFCH
jgi:hypothetical protein